MTTDIIPTVSDDKQYVEITLTKNNKTLGFNIVGGIDKPHIPGFSEIFVSRVNPNSEAAIDSKIEVGDLIVSLNGEILIGKTHQEVVDLFHAITNTCTLLIEKQAERRILNSPTLNLNTSTKNETEGSKSWLKFSLPESNTVNSTKLDNSGGLRTNSELLLDDLDHFPELPNKNSNLSKNSRLLNNETSSLNKKRLLNSNSTQSTNFFGAEEKENIDNSDSISVHSSLNVLENSSKSSKRLHTLFELSQNSIWSEILCVTLGTAVIFVSGFAVYRFLKK